MSTIKINYSQNIRAATVYAVYGTADNARKGKVRADALCTVQPNAESFSPEATAGRWSGVDFMEASVEEMERYAPAQRTDEAIIYIQSWAKDELDKDNPADVARANAAGSELAMRLTQGTGVPFTVATHTDSKSGCVHNHIVFANHDTQTKKAAPRDMRNWYKLRNINDELMRDLGMRVLEREPEISLLPAERRARKEGKSTDSTGLGVDELTAATWADFARKRMDELCADKQVADADDPLAKAVEIAGKYNLSLKVQPNSKTEGESLTVALVDDDGEDAYFTNTTKAGRTRKRKAAKAGSKLGRSYSLEGVTERVNEAQSALLARQLAALQANSTDDDLEAKYGSSLLDDEEEENYNNQEVFNHGVSDRDDEASPSSGERQDGQRLEGSQPTPGQGGEGYQDAAGETEESAGEYRGHSQFSAQRLLDEVDASGKRIKERKKQSRRKQELREQQSLPSNDDGSAADDHRADKEHRGSAQRPGGGKRVPNRDKRADVASDKDATAGTQSSRKPHPSRQGFQPSSSPEPERSDDFEPDF
ncbi:relaxase/mobilization nuclease domain-containing protein [Corynebacterium amycolatum]|uniref:relaxase/mobilization nuclease domain-containing protein n=1 Tax=Corynebacterium TaxID=1716 RepID=UPI0008A1532A|nr:MULTISPECIES: relaxase/mobilization nuclease domain-containing protein [Corynebacterium]ASE56449.1 relaxase [Corynebacterium jeikeium]KAA9246272.1 relaxase/mobilization nuclease domain-containing protein [Corynebacterium amycolatum]MBC6769363.1 relaxase [Corynebacterium sp. LK15]MBC6793698.1 relaxase [Corynebacterium sp. LK26]MBC6805701.1 relaxase [Corynebacterium sp. LK30]